jgi:8-oxo-dGTP pyrophosphatase MutT (NUDIX family)
MAFPANEACLTDLAIELDRFGIDPRLWKSGKTPADLLGELRDGESQLVLARVVHVVKMRIISNWQSGKELVELGKQHAGGEPMMHKKPRAPSGKKTAGETVHAALERELHEELHLEPTEVSLFERGEEFQTEDSRSFSGIWGIYRLFWFEVLLLAPGAEKLQAFWSWEHKRYEIPDQSEEGKKRGTMLYFAWAPLPDGH